MKFLIAIAFNLLLVTSGSAATPSKASSEGEISVSTLMERLDAEDFKTREKATEDLWTRGSESLPLLKRAISSPNPEVARRAEILIQYIDMGLTPSSHKDILDAIQRYRASDKEKQKLDALDELITLEAFKPALYLLDRQTTPAMRAGLYRRSRSVKKLALSAAAQEMGAGRMEEAITLLRLAPREDHNLRALAHLLKHSGSLEKELASPQAQENTPESIRWRQHLLQAKGDFAQLREFSKHHPEGIQPAALAMLDGDPLPLTELLIAKSPEPEHRITLNLFKETYEQNDFKKAKATLSSLIDNQDKEEYNQLLGYTCSAAFLLGEKELGEELLDIYSPRLAKSYYNSSEDPAKQFELLGTPNPQTEKGEFSAWLQEEIARELDEDLKVLDDQESKIVGVANFYFIMGEDDLALSILKPLLKELEEKDEERWIDILSILSRHVPLEEVTELLFARENQEQTLSAFYKRWGGDSKASMQLWDTVSKLYSTEAPTLRFISVMRLLGSEHPLAPPLREIENAIKSSGDDAESTELMLSLLVMACNHRGDFTRMLEFSRELCQISENKNPIYLAKYRSVAEILLDGAEIIRAYELTPEIINQSPQHTATYAVAQRKVGNRKKGDALLATAIAHTLGRREFVASIASLLNDAGYAEEAAQLWVSSIVTSTELDGEFFRAIQSLNLRSRIYHRTGKWHIAQSLTFAEKVLFLQSYRRSIEPSEGLRLGFNSNAARGLALVESGDMKVGIELLERTHHLFVDSGNLGDDFFVYLLQKNLDQHRKVWFQKSWKVINAKIQSYPKHATSRNNAAWVAACAELELDASIEHIEEAIKLSPEAAYVDTLAALHFAKGDRQAAIKHSDAALKSILDGTAPRSGMGLYRELKKQNWKFRHAALPKSRTN